MLGLSKVAICFPKMTVLKFVWCRAYGCRSVSVGLIFPIFLSAGALVPLYLVSMDPSKNGSRWRRGWQPCCELRENSAVFRMFY